MSNAGRPLKFKTAEEMEESINNYFSECDNNTVEVYSKKQQEIVEMKMPIPYTIEGLCSVLDVTRKTLLNYENKDEFLHTIKKAKKDILRNQVEAGLIGTANNAMTMFLLKNNHDYVDKKEVVQETTHKGETENNLKITFE